jgi:hypothetical protein
MPAMDESGFPSECVRAFGRRDRNSRYVQGMADKSVWLENSDHGIAVRALLWLERGGRYGDEACPWCVAGRGFHDPTCGLSFALTRHGLASSQQRDQARKEIESFPHASVQPLAVASTR